MKINDEIFQHVAQLSKLTFEQEEQEGLKKDLNKMLDLCEKLNELPLDDVEPLIFMSEEVNAFREDKVDLKLTKEEVLKNAPDKNSDYIKVPKVIERV